MKTAGDLLPRFLADVADLPRNEPAIVAVSGGCDSVVLLDLLRRARFRQLIVAHFHHGLRGAAADADAHFVDALARKNNWPFVLGRGRTRARAAKHKESVEEAARTLRRTFLAATAKKHAAATIFLAHHAGDVAETMLFHLARGGGRRGLTSLRTRAALEKSKALLVRPLLGFARGEIENYAQARRIAFCTDETNMSRDHTRNRLRHDVLPALAAAVGFAPEIPMARAAAILAEEDDWIESLVAAEARAVSLPVRLFRERPVAFQRRLTRAWLRQRIGVEIDFATTEAARAVALATNAPAKINLPGGHHLRRRGGTVFVEEASRPAAGRR
jgi:tRNA(Ile)-lysidine synthase